MLYERICKDESEIKIWNYDTFQTNKLKEYHNGVAVAVRNNAKYSIEENNCSGTLSIDVKTNLEDVTIVTSYVPPRTGYIHYLDVYSLLNTIKPTYLIGDLNARYARRLERYQRNGTQEIELIDRRHATHEGSHFLTYLTRRLKTSPDSILVNREAYHNSNEATGPLTPCDHIPNGIYHLNEPNSSSNQGTNKL